MFKKMWAAVDIGGTKTAVVLSKDLPHIDTRLAFPTRPDKGAEFAIEHILRSLREALSIQKITSGDLRAIGVSCGGPLDPVRGIIQAPPNLATWDGIAICDILKAEFGVPCYLENDANAGALAESKFGAGRGAKNLIFLTMGTGLGAGLILNGQLYRGVSHAAGEIGHVRLTRNGPQGHGRTGTVEGWASGGGMAQLAKTYAKSALNSGKTTLLTKGPDLGELNAHDVWIAARAGDVVAQAVVGKVGQRLGEAMAMLIDLINPDCIVVGGLAVRFGEDILQPARDVVMREALHGSAAACRILPAALGEQIGDVAALCVAMEGEIRDRTSATLDESIVQRQYV